MTLSIKNISNFSKNENQLEENSEILLEISKENKHIKIEEESDNNDKSIENSDYGKH